MNEKKNEKQKNKNNNLKNKDEPTASTLCCTFRFAAFFSTYETLLTNCS